MKLATLALLALPLYAQTDVILIPGTDQGVVAISIGGSTNFNPIAAQVGISVPVGATLSKIEASIPSKPLSTCLATSGRVNCVIVGQNVDRIPPGIVLRLTLSASTLACRPVAKITDTTAAAPDGTLSAITASSEVVRIAWSVSGDQNADGVVDEQDLAIALQRALAAPSSSSGSTLLELVRVIRGRLSPAADCPLP